MDGGTRSQTPLSRTTLQGVTSPLHLTPCGRTRYPFLVEPRPSRWSVTEPRRLVRELIERKDVRRKRVDDTRPTTNFYVGDWKSLTFELEPPLCLLSIYCVTLLVDQSLPWTTPSSLTLGGPDLPPPRKYRRQRNPSLLLLRPLRKDIPLSQVPQSPTHPLLGPFRRPDV